MQLTELIKKFVKEQIYQLSGNLEREMVAHVERTATDIFTSTIRKPESTLLSDNEKELLKIEITRLFCDHLRLGTDVHDAKYKIYFNLQLKYIQLRMKIEKKYKRELTMIRRKKIVEIASNGINEWKRSQIVTAQNS